MNWEGAISLFGISTFKFLFAPFGGKIAELTFIETYVSCCTGAILSASIFYFSANYFIRKSIEKNERIKQGFIDKGIPIPAKKRFTRINKGVIRIKRSLGIIGITFWAPFVLSVPLGSVITAKFYGHKKYTFLLIISGILLNGLITTGITYLF
jgi:hypothetical protein